MFICVHYVYMHKLCSYAYIMFICRIAYTIISVYVYYQVTILLTVVSPTNTTLH